ANDALLSGLKAELPSFISDIVVARPDGEIIGSAFGKRYGIDDRKFFQQIEAGQSITVGSPFLTRAGGRWIFPVAHPIRNAAGELQGVLMVGTLIEAFRGAMRVSQLPAGSIVRIVSDGGIAVASFPEVPDWVGRDLSKADNAARRLRTRE